MDFDEIFHALSAALTEADVSTEELAWGRKFLNWLSDRYDVVEDWNQEQDTEENDPLA